MEFEEVLPSVAHPGFCVGGALNLRMSERPSKRSATIGWRVAHQYFWVEIPPRSPEMTLPRLHSAFSAKIISNSYSILIKFVHLSDCYVQWKTPPHTPNKKTIAYLKRILNQYVFFTDSPQAPRAPLGAPLPMAYIWYDVIVCLVRSALS